MAQTINLGNDFIDNMFNYLQYIDHITKQMRINDENAKLSLRLAAAIESLYQAGKIDETQAKALLNSNPQTVAKLLPKIVSVPKKAIQGKDKAYIYDPLTGKVESEYDLTDKEQRTAYTKYLIEKAKNEGRVIIHDNKSNKILLINKDGNVKEIPYEEKSDFDYQKELIELKRAQQEALLDKRAKYVNKQHSGRLQVVYHDPSKMFQLMYRPDTDEFIAVKPHIDEEGQLLKFDVETIPRQKLNEIIPYQYHEAPENANPWYEQIFGWLDKGRESVAQQNEDFIPEQNPTLGVDPYMMGAIPPQEIGLGVNLYPQQDDDTPQQQNNVDLFDIYNQ